jgi:prolyl 4-hydroxylase
MDWAIPGEIAMKRDNLKNDRVFVIRDFLSPEECAAHIAATEAVGFRDAPITTSAGFVMRKDIRNNERVILDDVDLADRLYDRARPLLPPTWGRYVLCGLNERFRFYRYGPGQRFAPHYDGYFARDNGEESLLTFMVYLNDDFEGGTTNFLEEKPPLVVKPEAGMALVFVHQQLHEGASVLAGQKYVLRSDVMYR